MLLTDDLEKLAGRSVDLREPFIEYLPGVRALALPEEVKVEMINFSVLFGASLNSF